MRISHSLTLVFMVNYLLAMMPMIFLSTTTGRTIYFVILLPFCCLMAFIVSHYWVTKPYGRLSSELECCGKIINANLAAGKKGLNSSELDQAFPDEVFHQEVKEVHSMVQSVLMKFQQTMKKIATTAAVATTTAPASASSSMNPNHPGGGVAEWSEPIAWDPKSAKPVTDKWIAQQLFAADDMTLHSCCSHEDTLSCSDEENTDNTLSGSQHKVTQSGTCEVNVEGDENNGLVSLVGPPREGPLKLVPHLHHRKHRNLQNSLSFSQSAATGQKGESGENGEGEREKKYNPKYFPILPLNPGFVPPAWLMDEKFFKKISPPKVVKTWEQRMAEFNDEQQQVFEQFKEEVMEQGWWNPKGELNKPHVDPHNAGKELPADVDAPKVDNWKLMRFLIAREFKIKKSLPMLEKNLKWERETKPATVKCQYCPIDPGSHMNQWVGWDLQHRPVTYMSYKWCTMRTQVEPAMQHNMMNFEQAIGLMPVGVEQWIVMVDFVSYSHWKDSSSRMGRLMLEILQDNYPERLGMQILIDPPTTFWLLFKMVSPFMDDKTKKKLHMVYTDQKPCMDDVFPTLFPKHLSDYLIHAYKENKRIHEQQELDKKR